MVNFGREICGTLGQAEVRKWLATNVTGSYASGTVAGLLTGRYHGLLVAVLQPPLGRTLLLASEIFDGDAPMVPRGCIAQFWTVAEVLRVVAI